MGALDEAKRDKGKGMARFAENLLDVGIDGKGTFDSAAKVAREALSEHSSPEKAVDAIINSHLRLAAGAGFVTSLGGFVTLPVALPVNVAGFYLLATRMTAAVAAVRGYDITDPQIRSAVLLTLVGADADDLLAKAGVVAPGGRAVSFAAQRLPGPVLMVVNKGIAFRLLSRSMRGTLAKLGRGIPLVGGAVGAGLDGWLIHRIAQQARTEFPPTGAPAAGRLTQG